MADKAKPKVDPAKIDNSKELPRVRVKSGDGAAWVNLADYDPEVHELLALEDEAEPVESEGGKKKSGKKGE